MNNNTNDRRNEYNAKKRAYHEQKRREALEQAKKKSYRPYYIAVIAISLAIVICLGSAIVVSTLFSGVNASAEYTVRISGERSEAKLVDGKIMINLDALSKALNLQKTGTVEKPKFTSVSGDSIQFSDGDKTAKITVAGTKTPFSVEMNAKADADSDACLISLDAFSAFFSGITVTVNGETIKIARKTVLSDSSKLEEITIMNKNTEPLSRVLYLTDVMKEYDKYLNPENRDDYLILVNKQNPIEATYTPADLIDLDSSIKNGNINCDQMRIYAAKAIEAMLLDIEADYKSTYPNAESPIKAQSGYRTYEYQSSLFNGYIEKEMSAGISYEEAKEIVLTYSALPEASEHRTGLCIDLIDVRTGDLVNPFTKPYYMTWLKENAWKYGFILRYPEGEEDITGYSYESWHFRYVGRYHAERISALDLTLEEYLELIGK